LELPWEDYDRIRFKTDITPHPKKFDELLKTSDNLQECLSRLYKVGFMVLRIALDVRHNTVKLGLGEKIKLNNRPKPETKQENPVLKDVDIKKLKESGAILIGNTNMDEFAFGSSTESSYYGPTRNPWNLDYSPGGSTGGGASSVISGLTQIAIGSDFAGSIRIPAHFCGVKGYIPTNIDKTLLMCVAGKMV